MHCLKRLRITNAGVLQLLKHAVNSALVGSDSNVFSRSQQPFQLFCTSAALHHNSQQPHQAVNNLDQTECRNILISGMDLLFYTITEGKEMISVSQFVSALRSTGLWTSDPRLRDCMRHLRQSMRESAGTVMVDQKLFRKCVGANILLLTQAFRRKFIIPDFEVFASNMDQLYYSTQRQEGGHVADYIPQLAKFSPNLWGVSLCTVDGQRHSAGDTKVPFCLQSCVKPLEYAIAVHEIGTEHVHRYVGKEPSGLKFNQLSLNDEDKPHNPMVNAGAIVISSLLKPNLKNAERFDYVMEYLKKMAGTEYVGFSNATPQVFDWIEVRRLRWPWQNIDFVVTEPFLCGS